MAKPERRQRSPSDELDDASAAAAASHYIYHVYQAAAAPDDLIYLDDIHHYLYFILHFQHGRHTFTIRRHDHHHQWHVWQPYHLRGFWLRLLLLRVLLVWLRRGLLRRWMQVAVWDLQRRRRIVFFVLQQQHATTSAAHLV